MEADFSSVWSRVTGSAAQEAPDAQLRRFLLSEAEDVCMLRAILRQTCDVNLRKSLTQICTDKSRHLKRLRTALYLLAGECECPSVSRKDAPQSLLPALKALYARVSASASEYRKAASATDRSALETIYSSLAEAETRHAACLTSCVERLM